MKEVCGTHRDKAKAMRVLNDWQRQNLKIDTIVRISLRQKIPYEKMPSEFEAFDIRLDKLESKQKHELEIYVYNDDTTNKAQFNHKLDSLQNILHTWNTKELHFHVDGLLKVREDQRLFDDESGILPKKTQEMFKEIVSAVASKIVSVTLDTSYLSVLATKDLIGTFSGIYFPFIQIAYLAPFETTDYYNHPFEKGHPQVIAWNKREMILNSLKKNLGGTVTVEYGTPIEIFDTLDKIVKTLRQMEKDLRDGARNDTSVQKGSTENRIERTLMQSKCGRCGLRIF